MLRKLIFILSLLFVLFGLSSCIDLVEKININNDLSGHYELKLETSGFGGFNFGGDMDIPQINELDERMNLLTHQQGISHIKKNISVKDMQFSLSFDFDDEKSLNNAMYALAEIKPNMFLKKFLKIKKHKIIRPNLSPYLQRIIDDQEFREQIPSTDLLKYVNYKFMVITPKDIKSVNGERAMIQNDNRTIISSYNFKELIVDKANVYVKIKM